MAEEPEAKPAKKSSKSTSPKTVSVWYRENRYDKGASDERWVNGSGQVVQAVDLNKTLDQLAEAKGAEG